MPSEPGVYQFFNKEDKIIYIGKAKNLKKRVSSYFQKNVGSRKTKNLIEFRSTTGFTFALELVIKSFFLKLKIKEIPSTWSEIGNRKSNFKKRRKYLRSCN